MANLQKSIHARTSIIFFTFCQFVIVIFARCKMVEQYCFGEKFEIQKWFEALKKLEPQKTAFFVETK
jgi:hypothetical protein